MKIKKGRAKRDSDIVSGQEFRIRRPNGKLNLRFLRKRDYPRDSEKTNINYFLFLGPLGEGGGVSFIVLGFSHLPKLM